MAFVLVKSLLQAVIQRAKPSRVNMPAVDPVIQLDKPSFSAKRNVYALRVPKILCNGTRKAVKDHVLTMHRVLSIVPPTTDEQSSHTVPFMFILLKYLSGNPEDKYQSTPKGNTDLTFVDAGADQVLKTLRECDVPAATPVPVQKYIAAVNLEHIHTREVHIDYSHWPIDCVLKALIPSNVTIPSSFETIGHIAHLNLREEQLPFKAIIGSAMLDKLSPRIKTIVNKLESTGGPYRTFAMEVIAGEQTLLASVKENGCNFKMDFSKVYWNSRLEAEHRRIIRSLRKHDILADAFCGIGPFAIPAAKQSRCQMVYANDLNPSSVKYLQENIKTNKVNEDTIQTSCSCAKQFLVRLVTEQNVPVTRVIMNFPSGAPEFLDVFRGLYKAWNGDKPTMPSIHCYCFVKGLEDFDSARERVRQALCGDVLDADRILPYEKIEVRDIRDVAPRKRQVCITLQVPEEVAFYNGETGENEPLQKRARTE